jgi:hypothetical protein
MTASLWPSRHALGVIPPDHFENKSDAPLDYPFLNWEVVSLPAWTVNSHRVLPPRIGPGPTCPESRIRERIGPTPSAKSLSFCDGKGTRTDRRTEISHSRQ